MVEQLHHARLDIVRHRVHDQLRRFRRFAGGGDAGEVGDLAGAGVEAPSGQYFTPNDTRTLPAICIYAMFRTRSDRNLVEKF